MKILVIRFSAMGDVALLAAACKAWIQENPQAEMRVLTRPQFKAFFQFSNKVNVIPVDLKGKHKGFAGLAKLYQEIKSQHSFDYVIDAHDVLRTKVLRTFFKLSGHRVSVYKKERAEKKKMTRRNQKIRTELIHTVQRYLDAFPLNKVTWSDEYLPVLQFQKTTKKRIQIGVAPFAQHELKVLPLNTLIETLKLLKDEIDIFLFGGGADELEKMRAIQREIPEVKIVADMCSHLDEELQLMASLNLMLSMDSANMHMATLVGTPVVSIWGSTHPDLGFKALGSHNDELQVQISTDELTCRPCSVFGNNTCYRGDTACLKHIEAQAIVDKIHKSLTL